MKIRTNYFCRFIASLVVSTGLVSSPVVAAADHEDDSFDLSTLKCWDFTLMEDDERLPALLMVYGYVAGTHNMAVQSGKRIETSLKRVGKLCTSNPDMYVSSAVERTLPTAKN